MVYILLQNGEGLTRIFFLINHDRSFVLAECRAWGRARVCRRHALHSARQPRPASPLALQAATTLLSAAYRAGANVPGGTIYIYIYMDIYMDIYIYIYNIYIYIYIDR